jgi:NAD(P)-dependent dehydrogenase (short-subunit alcohol dehydrogenase family)
MENKNMQRAYVVTGASSGIGYALCCHLAGRNKKVVAIARRADRLAKLKACYPQHIFTITADLGTVAGRKFAVAQLQDLTPIAGLVNNAATNDPIDYLENLSLENWHQQCAINIDAPIFFTQSLIPYLSGGRIINITTGTTQFILSGVAGYAITKAALNTFTKYLSDEVRSKNILVTAAHPGIIDTELGVSISQHPNQQLAIAQVKKKLKEENKYLDVEISAKFLAWLLINADASLYTGDIIGIYNQKYQPLWHDEIIPSPYPGDIKPP